MPNSTVRFFFGLHSTTEDALATRDHLDWCDVYVPELAGWTPGALLMYRAVSSGDVEAFLAMQLLDTAYHEFHAAELEMLEASGRRIEFIDVPGHSPLFPLVAEMDRSLEALIWLGTWALARSAADLLIEAQAKTHRLRDLTILASLEDLVGRVSGARILVRLGVAHSALAKEAAGRGMVVETAFQRLRWPFTNDGLVAYYGSLNRAIPLVVVSRLVLSRLMMHHYTKRLVVPDGERPPVTLTRIVNSFSESEIAQLWDKAQGAGDDAFAILVDAGRAKGFAFRDGS